MKMSEVKLGQTLYHPKHGSGVVTHIYKDSVSLIYQKMTVAALSKYEIKSCNVAQSAVPSSWPMEGLNTSSDQFIEHICNQQDSDN
jgi:hypothetical protein